MNNFFVNTVSDNEDITQCVREMERILSKFPEVIKPGDSMNGADCQETLASGMSLNFTSQILL